jgi:TRAP-type C4-dicarboxylate transport system permease small subunit
MNRLLRTLGRISAALDKAAVLVAKSGILVMVVCISIQIIARYVLSEPPAWTEELARYAMIWAGLAGATIACRRRLDPTLVNAALLKRKSHRTLSRWVEAVAILVFCIPVLIATPAFMALHSQRFTDSLQLPSHLVVAIIPLCFITIIFHALVRLLFERAREREKEISGAELP